MDNQTLEPVLSIMLVEDQVAYRKVIKLALARDESLQLTFEFGTAEFALRELQNPSQTHHPDVILLDLNLPGMSGLEAIPWIQRYCSEAKILILTQSKDDHDVLQAIQAGASGYLLKSSSPSEIKEGIRKVTMQESVLDSKLVPIVFDTLKNQLPSQAPTGKLSDREAEILSLLARGYSKKEIAQLLQITEHTVVFHTKNVYEKLGAANAPEAINNAYQCGILPIKG